MQIKLKDESLIPFVDSVFAEHGFKKEIKLDGEREYVPSGDNSFGKIMSVIRPLRNKTFVAACEKWELLQLEQGECVYSENCIEEFNNYNGK